MRQAYVRPVTLAVAPVPASTPGYHGSWPYNWVVSISGPTLEKRRSRRREPDHQPLRTAANQGKALAIEGLFFREVGMFYRGVDSTRRGKAPPLAILSPISHR